MLRIIMRTQHRNFFRSPLISSSSFSAKGRADSWVSSVVVRVTFFRILSARSLPFSRGVVGSTFCFLAPLAAGFALVLAASIATASTCSAVPTAAGVSDPDEPADFDDSVVGGSDFTDSFDEIAGGGAVAVTTCFGGSEGTDSVEILPEMRAFRSYMRIAYYAWLQLTKRIIPSSVSWSRWTRQLGFAQ